MIKRVLSQHSMTDLLQWGYRRSFGYLTNQSRLLPDFIIIGVQRGGTTSLFNYLSQHPDIYPCHPKETHFFSNNYQKGINWYRSHFPLSIHKNMNGNDQNRSVITGEATPYYVYHPLAPQRVSETLPNVSLILLLRNPVDRAYSHYHHEVKMGIETLSFEEAIEKERQRLENEKDKLLEDGAYRSFNYQHFSYMNRGIYIDQIKAWHRYFDRAQFCIIQSEWLNDQPVEAFQQVLNFLGVSKWELKEQKKYHRAKYPPMDIEVRKRLSSYYKPYNQNLSEYLDIEFIWK